MLIKELYKSDDLEFNCMINNKIKIKEKTMSIYLHIGYDNSKFY